MKKFLIFLLLIFPILFFVSCGSDDDDGGNADSVADTSADTAPGDSTDSDSSDSSADSGSDTASDTTQDGDTTNDTDNTDTVPENDEPGKTDEGCVIFTVEDPTFGKVYWDTYLGDVRGNILGDKNDRDVFELFIFQSQDTESYAEIMSHPGTYDLGKGDNKSAVNCTECLAVKQDFMTEKEKMFFQESGTLVISEVDKQNNIKGTLTAKLVEVTGDPTKREAEVEKVEGGACIVIENWSFNSDNCVPDCSGKLCGDDGCGGICNGGCGKDAYCNEAQTQCIPYSCKKISFDPFEIGSADEGGNYYKAHATGKSAGSTALDDILTLHFYDEEMELITPSAGVVDLGSETNASFDTCTECVLFYEDVDFDDGEDGSFKKLYFQQSGELVFEEVREGTFESKGHGSFRVVEVDEYYEPVEGGNCYEVENMTWDTIAVP